MNSDCALRNRKNTHHYKKHYTVEVSMDTLTPSQEAHSFIYTGQIQTNDSHFLLSVRMSPSLVPAAAPDVQV